MFTFIFIFPILDNIIDNNFIIWATYNKNQFNSL